MRFAAVMRGVAPVLAVLASAGLGAADPVTITHAKGELTLAETPKRVVVFDLATLDTLQALGVDGVVGLPKGEDGSVNVPSYLSAYGDAKYAGVGTLFEPNLEKLKEIKPDLIVLAGRSAGKYPEVSAIAPTLDLSPGAKPLFEASVDLTRTLGKIFDVEEVAETKVAELTAAVEEMRASAPEEKALVLFAVERAIMPHAPGARFGTIYEFTGLTSVMEPAKPSTGPRPEAGSPEAIAAQKAAAELFAAALKADPAWIITLDRGSISSSEPSKIAERIAADPAIAATTAVTSGQVIHLDPRAWYLVGHGVQNLTQTAQEITAAFHAKH